LEVGLFTERFQQTLSSHIVSADEILTLTVGMDHTSPTHYIQGGPQD